MCIRDRFLTVLIWVWADLALDERYTVVNTPIRVARAVDPSLWVSFDDKAEAVLDSIVLKGPAAKIADIRRKINDGRLRLELFLVPEREGFSQQGRYTLNVADFLKRSQKIRQLGVTVEQYEPKTLDVRVDRLVKRDVTVECVDENGIVLKAQSIRPSKVSMYVPADRSLTARVQLTKREIEQARASAIEKRPYIELAAGQRREAAVAVEIEMPPVAEELKASGVSLVIYTDIKRDGMASGPNLEAARELSALGLSFILSGGIASLEDLERVKGLPGLVGVIVGRALYEGLIDLREAIRRFQG